MKIRLNKIQKDLNLDLSTIVEFLRNKGFEIKEEPNAVVSEEGYNMLVEKFYVDKNIRTQAEGFIQERQNKKNTKIVAIDEPKKEKPIKSNRFDIFVSYSRADIDIVRKLVDDIHAKSKARCWIDWNGIESGDQFVDVIINAIDKVNTVLFILSDNSMSSEFARREIDYARNTGKKIVPVVVDGGKLRGWFLFFFGSVDYIDIKVPMQYEKLLRNIGDWFGSKSVTNEIPQHNEIKAAQKVADSPAVTSKTYKIGDFYDENGKQGIVFDVTADGKHGKIVSLDSQELKWAELDAYNTRTSATSVDDGMSNLNKIKEIPNWETNYPAFAWCASKGDGWYLPAKNELLFIRTNMETINQSLKKIYTKITDFAYWSSTEQSDFCAWLVIMDDGYIGNYDKSYRTYVRAVSAF